MYEVIYNLFSDFLLLDFRAVSTLQHFHNDININIVLSMMIINMKKSDKLLFFNIIFLQHNVVFIVC